MLVYLAGPIDGVSRVQAEGWRELFKEEAPLDWSYFNPAAAFTLQSPTKDDNFKVSNINRQAIAGVDVVFANLAHGLGLGTVREIEFARKLHKPVVVLVEHVGHPLGVEWWDLEVVDTLMDAIERIKVVT